MPAEAGIQIPAASEFLLPVLRHSGYATASAGMTEKIHHSPNSNKELDFFLRKSIMKE